MKLPLIVEAKPQLNASGPLVYLLPGMWKLQHNVSSSEIGIMLDFSPIELDTLDNLIMGGDQTIQVFIKKQGSESSITIYAIKQE